MALRNQQKEMVGALKGLASGPLDQSWDGVGGLLGKLPDQSTQNGPWSKSTALLRAISRSVLGGKELSKRFWARPQPCRFELKRWR